jgi:hypothetical protein
MLMTYLSVGANGFGFFQVVWVLHFPLVLVRNQLVIWKGPHPTSLVSRIKSCHMVRAGKGTSKDVPLLLIAVNMNQVECRIRTWLAIVRRYGNFIMDQKRHSPRARKADHAKIQPFLVCTVARGRFGLRQLL